MLTGGKRDIDIRYIYSIEALLLSFTMNCFLFQSEHWLVYNRSLKTKGQSFETPPRAHGRRLNLQNCTLECVIQS